MALGIADPAELPARDVERLKSLMLVEEHEAALRLTPVGKQRYRGLPNSAAFELKRTRRSIGKDGGVHQQGPGLIALGMAMPATSVKTSLERFCQSFDFDQRPLHRGFIARADGEQRLVHRQSPLRVPGRMIFGPHGNGGQLVDPPR